MTSRYTQGRRGLRLCLVVNCSRLLMVRKHDQRRLGQYGRRAADMPFAGPKLAWSNTKPDDVGKVARLLCCQDLEHCNGNLVLYSVFDRRSLFSAFFGHSVKSLGEVHMSSQYVRSNGRPIKGLRCTLSTFSGDGPLLQKYIPANGLCLS